MSICVSDLLMLQKRTYADKDIKEAERYKEGKENSHLPNDSSEQPGCLFELRS